MKYLLIFVIVAILFTGSVLWAQEVPLVLEWDNPNAAGEVGEFILYESQDEVSWSEKVRIPGDVLNTTVVFTARTGKWFYHITAKNYIAESGPSNVLAIQTNNPNKLINFRIKKD